MSLHVEGSEAPVAAPSGMGTGQLQRFQRQLADTAKRYAARRASRETSAGRLGDPLSADAPDRVRARLRRFGLTQDGPALRPVTFPSEVPGTREPPSLVLERILGRSDLLSISFLERGVQVSRAVARVLVKDSAGRLLGYGTGFLVSPRLLLTNHHVLPEAAHAAGSEAEFEFEASPDGSALSSSVFHFEPGTFFHANAALDFALVAVAPVAVNGRHLEEFGSAPLLASEGEVLLGEYVNIIQHPNGAPKQLALRENQVVDVLDTFLHYRTDTAPGSSGSPVFNDQWEVVALHHSGVPKTKDGHIVTPDGEPWTPEMGEGRIAWEANEGVRVRSILAALAAARLGRAARALMEPLGAPELHRTPTAPPPSAERPPEEHVVDARVVSGTAEVPLRIRLSVEAAPSLAPAHAGLDAALSELAGAKRRPYYDENADARARAAYYAPLGREAPGFEALRAHLEQTHREKLRYHPMEHVYPLVDLHPDFTLRSLYSGKAFDPESLIREDFRVEALRAERLGAELARGLEVSTFEEVVDALERALPYNCEHVVPQSWFGKREPMRGDLHHLFACEAGCNSFRGNTPYFDFADFEEADRTDCGRRLTNHFEPSHGKGPAARATLYFLVRYPHEIDANEAEYQTDRLLLLLAWHAAEPVTDWERHRNAEIFRKQGNRNPFIDFPEWAGGIDFRQGLALLQ